MLWLSQIKNREIDNTFMGEHMRLTYSLKKGMTILAMSFLLLVAPLQDKLKRHLNRLIFQKQLLVL